jgi:hypothetical protein
MLLDASAPPSAVASAASLPPPSRDPPPSAGAALLLLPHAVAATARRTTMEGRCTRTLVAYVRGSPLASEIPLSHGTRPAYPAIVRTRATAGWAFACATLVGCTTSSAPPAATADAGDADASDASGDQSPDGMVKISGTVVKFSTPGMGLAGATIAASGATTVSDSNGEWALEVPTGQLFALDFSAPMYVHATNAEQSLSGNSPGNTFPLVDDATAQLLLQSFARFQKQLGAIAVIITGEATCPNTTGATFQATPSAPGGGLDGGEGPIVLYFSAENLPAPKATSAINGTSPAAVIYNVPTGVDIEVTVKHPGCKQDPFPIVVGPGTYTGKLKTSPAETSSTSLAISYLTTYLK